MNSNDPHKPSIRRWVTLIILGLAFFLSLVDRQILTVLVDPIKTDLGMSETQVGLLGFAFAVFYAVLGIPVAFLADRWIRKIIIGVGLIVWSAATLMAGFARTFGILFTTRIGVGVGEACLAPAAFSMCTDLFGPKLIGRALGIFHTMGALGIAGSAAIGGWLLSHFNETQGMELLGHHVPPWGLTLVAVGAPGVLLGIVVLLFIREPSRMPDSKPVQADLTGRPALLSILLAERGHLLRLLLAIAVLSIGSNGFVNWVPTYLLRVFGITPVQLGTILGLTFGVGALAGPLIGGTASDFFYKRIGRKAPIMLLAGCAVVFAVACALIPLADTLASACVIVAVISLVFPTILSLAATAIQLDTPSAVRAQVSSLYLGLNTAIGLGLGYYLVSVATQHIFGSMLDVGKSITLVGISAAVPGLLLVMTLLRRPAEQTPVTAG